ncbi:MAG: MarR family transcriptional regulator [Pseudomonadota bacterium]
MTAMAPHDGRAPARVMRRHTQRDATGIMVNRPSDQLRLWFFALRVHKAVFEQLNQELKTCAGISLTQFDALAQLEKHPDGVSMSDLSTALRVTSGNVSGLVTRMARDGLVERRLSATDRRSFTVSMTPKGRHRFRDAVEVHDLKLNRLMSDLSAQELTDAVAAMRKVAAGLKLAQGRDRIEDLPDL